MDSQKDYWGWWHARAEEDGAQGPFETREGAISEAVGSGSYCGDEDGRHVHRFVVFEAEQAPLRLADWIGADRLLEEADDRLCDSDRVAWEGDEGPWFEATSEQEADLISRMKSACDEWQRAHGLTFHSRTFSAERGAEVMAIPAELEGGA